MRRVTAATALRGLDLLDAAIARIEADPSSWDQDDWRCSTGICLAGHVAEIAGGEWAASAVSEIRAYLIPASGDNPCDVHPAEISDLGQELPPRVHAAVRARQLLGFSQFMYEALDDHRDPRDLFYGSNTLAEIKAMRDDLRAHLGGAA